MAETRARGRHRRSRDSDTRGYRSRGGQIRAQDGFFHKGPSFGALRVPVAAAGARLVSMQAALTCRALISHARRHKCPFPLAFFGATHEALPDKLSILGGIITEAPDWRMKLGTGTYIWQPLRSTPRCRCDHPACSLSSNGLVVSRLGDAHLGVGPVNLAQRFADFAHCGVGANRI